MNTWIYVTSTHLIFTDWNAKRTVKPQYVCFFYIISTLAVFGGNDPDFAPSEQSSGFLHFNTDWIWFCLNEIVVRFKLTVYVNDFGTVINVGIGNKCFVVCKKV